MGLVPWPKDLGSGMGSLVKPGKLRDTLLRYFASLGSNSMLALGCLYNYDLASLLSSYHSLLTHSSSRLPFAEHFLSALSSIPCAEHLHASSSPQSTEVGTLEISVLQVRKQAQKSEFAQSHTLNKRRSLVLEARLKSKYEVLNQYSMPIILAACRNISQSEQLLGLLAMSASCECG